MFVIQPPARPSLSNEQPGCPLVKYAPFPAVTGNPAEAILIYIDTGSAATSRLVAWIDTATNLPVTPNGGDISIQWNASGIFQL